MEHSIEIKIKAVKQGLSGNSAMDALMAIFEGRQSFHSLQVHREAIPELRISINNWLKDAVTVREGVTGGCYGARDGSSSEGLTLWVDPTVFDERWLDDDDGAEIVNIARLLDDNATCIEDLDGDAFLDAVDALGLEVKCDNTYNYLGTSADAPHTLQDVDFHYVQTSPDDYGCLVAVVAFHCGGDVRGNYTSKSVWKFSDSDAFYSVFNPVAYLKDDDNGEAV